MVCFNFVSTSFELLSVAILLGMCFKFISALFELSSVVISTIDIFHMCNINI